MCVHIRLTLFLVTSLYTSMMLSCFPSWNLFSLWCTSPVEIGTLIQLVVILSENHFFCNILAFSGFVIWFQYWLAFNIFWKLFSELKDEHESCKEEVQHLEVHRPLSGRLWPDSQPLPDWEAQLPLQMSRHDKRWIHQCKFVTFANGCRMILCERKWCDKKKRSWLIEITVRQRSKTCHYQFLLKAICVIFC